MTIDEGITRSRDVNRLRLLRTLLRQPARSRADLGRTLGLSRATITALVSELEDAGIVEQQADELAEDRPRTIGRPPLQVSLAPRSAYAVGLDFGHRHVRVALCDLSGEIVADRWSAASVDDAPLAAFDLARELTEAVLEEAGVGVERVIGAGAGLPVPVDPAAGTIFAAEILPAWNGVQPAAELRDRLELPVQIENDANAGAMGEHLFGSGRGVSNMAYVQLSAGVGVGLILGGTLYRGTSGVAGELGHTAAVEGGLICRCGNRGCLETIITPVAIAELLSRSRGEELSVTDLLALVAAGDRGARRAVADAGIATGAALAATINLLNPELVIIGGTLAAAGDVLLDPIREAVRARCVVPAANAVRIEQSMLAERAEVLGAAAIQLAHAPDALARRLL